MAGRLSSLPDLGTSDGVRRIRPIRWEDRHPIRKWRNDQLAVLRQSAPLSPSEQDAFYAEVLAPLFDQDRPSQVLLAFEENDRIVGYGGFVHIVWDDARAELSFLMATDRAESESWADDWRSYLPLLTTVASEQLGLRRLTTETFAFRGDVLSVMEECGFVREGVLREHHRFENGFCDSVVCGLLL